MPCVALHGQPQVRCHYHNEHQHNRSMNLYEPLAPTGPKQRNLPTRASNGTPYNTSCYTLP